MKYRLNLYLEAEHARRLRDVAALKGESLSAIIAVALTQYFSPEATQGRSASTATRLDRLSRQFGNIERDQTIFIETFALFLRYYLSLTVPLSDDRQEAARVQGQTRYTQFMARLGRELQQGHSFVRELVDEIYPEGAEGVAGSTDDDASPPGSVGVNTIDVAVHSSTHIASARHSIMLRTALGDAIAGALDDADVIEIMVNPDGRLWLDRLSVGRTSTDTVLHPLDVERIVRLVAAHARQEVHARAPIVSAELPDRGERFQGMLPPVVAAPIFCIRKRASSVIAFETWVAQGWLAADHAAALIDAIHARRNILIAGATSSGKTTFANALLGEIAVFGDRIVVLEDTVELQCSAQDHLALRTLPGVASMRDLVHATLRLRPDRIIVGEVRGGEALDLIKAWGTGHRGGIATVHAGSAQGALHRLEQLILEASAAIPRHLIAEAVDLIVVMRQRNGMRIVSDVVSVVGLDADRYVLKPNPIQGDVA